MLDATTESPEADLRRRFRQMMAGDHARLLQEVTHLADRNYDTQLPPTRVEQMRKWMTDPTTEGLGSKLLLTLAAYVYYMPIPEVTDRFKRMPLDQRQSLDAAITEIARQRANYWV